MGMTIIPKLNFSATHHLWLLDPKLSGGCIFDLHIHDVDLINWLFGKPDSLNSMITNRKIEQESVCTKYIYGDDLTVVANADWSLPQEFPFKAHCMINFDDAVVIIENDKMMIYTDSGNESIEFFDNDCFMEQERAFISWVIDDVSCDIISCESIYDSVYLVTKELESAASKKSIDL